YTVANNATAVVIPVTSPAITSADLAFTSFSSITSTTGVNGIYVVNAVVGANNISVTFNAVTNAAVNNAPTQISYAVLRPAGVTAASGYIVASGHVTTVASTNGAA